MPCTQHEDQEQQNGRMSFRPTFSRTFAGLRFSEQQNLQSFSISPSHHINSGNRHHHHNRHHHVPTSPSSNPMPSSAETSVNSEDLTEQIRISVQDTHISQRSIILGGNSSEVLGDNYDESTPRVSYNSQGILGNELGGLVRQNSSTTSTTPTASTIAPSNFDDNQMPTSSSQTSVIYTPQPSNSSVNPRMRRITQNNNELNHCKYDHVSTIKATNNIIQQQQQSPYKQNILQAVANTSESTLSSNPNNESNLNGHQNLSRKSSVTRLEALISPEKCKLSDAHQDAENGTNAHKTKTTSENDKRLNILQEMISPINGHNQAGVIRNYLFAGSSFSGFQRSKNESYEVNVKIQHVDYDNSYLCGYLCINHLTKSHPSLTTFFEGEIISKQYPFLTRKWEATEEIDRAHWSKFGEFSKKFSQTFNLDSFDYNELKESDYIYMRWKEHFLVPDHTVKHVEGASYAGFYYICYSKQTSCIRGYYFHINSEHFER